MRSDLHRYAHLKKKTLCFVTAGLLALRFAIALPVVDYQFNDDNGTSLDSAVNAGSDSGTWNFGSFQTQTDYTTIGALNVGYTEYYKSAVVDASSSPVYRKHELGSALTTGQYQLDVDIAKWDLRRNWDPNTDSAANKGIQFSLMGSDGTSANVRFDTQGASGFRAVGSGTGASQAQVNGGVFDNSLARFESDGGLLRIEANLDSGEWTASANDGEGGAFKDIVSGSGLLVIEAIRFNALSPAEGSWGGAGSGTGTDPTAGGTTGDYMRVDSLTLTAVPESGTYPLLAGILAWAWVALRRRIA